MLQCSESHNTTGGSTRTSAQLGQMHEGQPIQVHNWVMHLKPEGQSLQVHNIIGYEKHLHE